jgi:excisionase family DNA binding protein
MKQRIVGRPSGPPTLLTIKIAADRLGCSLAHVYRLVATGDLRAVDISVPGSVRSKTRIREDDLGAYIDKNTRGRRRPAGDAA